MTAISLEDAQRLNPLIDSDGDSCKVRQVLIEISRLVEEGQEFEHGSLGLFGITGVLRVCSAALEYMDREINQK